MAVSTEPSATKLSEREAWVVLGSVEGVGDVILGHLVAEFGDAAGAVEALRRGALHRTRLLPPELRRLSGDLRALLEAECGAAEKKLEQLEEAGIWTLTPLDPAYPPRLRVLDPPPSVLYGSGDASVLLSERAVAVVGTRRPSPSGRALTARLAARLVECGATVVSGLAFGVDGAAHAATLERGGRTVAVIGGGHDHAGPRAHRRLMALIAASGGAVVAELPPHLRPTRGTFPRRNRIISALADATVVVEAPARSGALITAGHALEQGRPLFVAPGRAGDALTAGCLTLLRETPARVITGLDDLVADLGFGVQDATVPGGSSAAAAGTATRPTRLSRAAALDLLGPAERLAAEAVCRGPATTDRIATETELPARVVAAAVTLLLLRGWIQPVGPVYLPAGPLLQEAGGTSRAAATRCYTPGR